MPKKQVMQASSSEDVMTMINSTYGAGTMVRGTDPSLVLTRVPTGIIAFDVLLGGGIAKGRFTEFYGTYSSLKSFMGAAAVASFQQEFPELRCCWIDSEGSYTEKWMQHFGIDTEMLDVVYPPTGETATAIVEAQLKSKGYSLYVIDSITALMPTRETEYVPEEGDKAMGAAGKMTSAMMRRLQRLIKNDATVILINQVRDNIGVMFGDASKPTGGRAIPFYAGQRVEFKRGENLSVESSSLTVGGKPSKRKKVESRVVNLRVEKDKTGGQEGAMASLLWWPKKGEIDEEESLLILGIETGCIGRAGASVTFFPDSSKNKQNVRGWDAAKELIGSDISLRGKLRKRIMEAVN